MTNHDLLRAKRDVYVLAAKPHATEGYSDHFWSMQIGGLHKDHLRQAADDLRKDRLPHADSESKKRALKSSKLLDSLAHALGAKSYDQWLDAEQPKIATFLSDHEMCQPADLIKWAYSPGLAGALKAQQLAGRLFNSGLQLPKRIFTGVGSFLFAPSGYGRLDIMDLAQRTMSHDEQLLEFCSQHADSVVLRADCIAKGGPPSMNLTGRMLMLNAVSEYIGCMYTLVGDSLMVPTVDEPAMRSYKMSEKERAFELQLFKLFREEIERSDDGSIPLVLM